MTDSVVYHPVKLTDAIWEKLTKKMQEDKRNCWSKVEAAVSVCRIDPLADRISYKGETHFVTSQIRGRHSYPVPLPESCHSIMDMYMAKRDKLDEDYRTFKSCFGSLVPHLRSQQDLRNILPDTFVNRIGFLSDVPRTMAIEDMSFQNMTPFNQYREIIIPLIDWYLGMELML